jgi:hypothetical protein
MHPKGHQGQAEEDLDLPNHCRQPCRNANHHKPHINTGWYSWEASRYHQFESPSRREQRIVYYRGNYLVSRFKRPCCWTSQGSIRFQSYTDAQSWWSHCWQLSKLTGRPWPQSLVAWPHHETISGNLLHERHDPQNLGMSKNRSFCGYSWPFSSQKPLHVRLL